VLKNINKFGQAEIVMPGVVALKGPAFISYEETHKEMEALTSAIKEIGEIPSCPMIIVSDDSKFISETLSNFLWVSFTRSNP
ncbi:hypothetical protein, partial [Pseudomonas sp. 2995-1]|uniref:hypothetical protein n=1 Tax=Pseudomonas sp. 2995-1 TaxID=1712679 RepID=UPI001C43E752